MFERFGEVKDVYMPRDYYTRVPRGFAFVEFIDRRDATDALEQTDGTILDGREINVQFAQDERKSSDEMRRKEG